MTNEYQTITVGELKTQLSGLDDDHKLSFSGGLSFYKLKRWGDDEHVFLFDEPEGDLSDDFKKRNPNVKVVFIGSENTEWDSEGITGQIDISVR